MWLTARVYDENFEPVNAASAVATIHAPDGSNQEIQLRHSAEEEGVFEGEVTSQPTGVYNRAAVFASSPSRRRLMLAFQSSGKRLRKL